MNNSNTLSEQGRVSLSAEDPFRLDERLLLAASLYEPCALGADVGTDHGLLPRHLLAEGVCKRMIVADISEKALRHARETIRLSGLEDRAEIVCADGLHAVTRPCGCVSIMGMGGETMAEILRRGQGRLHGAALVLSAHTEQHLVREVLRDIGYRITAERLCLAEGRYYIFWKAVPGQEDVTDSDLRYGRLLFEHNPEHLPGYLAWRIKYLTGKLKGLRSASAPDAALIARIEQDLAFYQARQEECSHADRQAGVRHHP